MSQPLPTNASDREIRAAAVKYLGAVDVSIVRSFNRYGAMFELMIKRSRDGWWETVARCSNKNALLAHVVRQNPMLGAVRLGRDLANASRAMRPK